MSIGIIGSPSLIMRGSGLEIDMAGGPKRVREKNTILLHSLQFVFLSMTSWNHAIRSWSSL